MRALQYNAGHLMQFHIAQLNVGRLLHPLDHPQIAEFVNGLDGINALAERSEGFRAMLELFKAGKPYRLE